MVTPENCAAENQLQLLQQTVNTGVRKRFNVIAKESLLASVSGQLRFCSLLVNTRICYARDDLKESAAATGDEKSKQGENSLAAVEKPAHLVVCEHVVRCTADNQNNVTLLLYRHKHWTLVKYQPH